MAKSFLRQLIDKRFEHVRNVTHRLTSKLFWGRGFWAFQWYSHNCQYNGRNDRIYNNKKKTFLVWKDVFQPFLSFFWNGKICHFPLLPLHAMRCNQVLPVSTLCWVKPQKVRTCHWWDGWGVNSMRVIWQRFEIHPISWCLTLGLSMNSKFFEGQSLVQYCIYNWLIEQWVPKSKSMLWKIARISAPLHLVGGDRVTWSIITGVSHKNFNDSVNERDASELKFKLNMMSNLFISQITKLYPHNTRKLMQYTHLSFMSWRHLFITFIKLITTLAMKISARIN